MRHSGFMQVVEQIPDSVKASVSIPVPVLAFYGVPIEQWVFVLSAILTLLFIIEKLPKAFMSLKWFYRKLFKRDNSEMD